MTPETMLISAWSSIMPMLSTSLVKRLISSPVVSLSWKRSGRRSTRVNRSSRMAWMAFRDTPIISFDWSQLANTATM